MIQFGTVLQAGKRLLTTRWTYVGVAVVAMVAATSMALGGGTGSCNESKGQLGSRLSELEKTYAATYSEASADMQNCQSLDCERPVKLEIATALRSYSQGLNQICWPPADQSPVKALIAANASAAAAYSSWADATTPADDQVFATAAERAVRRQQATSTSLTIVASDR
ncbi:MAG TPA: hypothetical protein VIT43_12085 [Candidatus Dormibacteraeota bacterium]